jgi:centrin-3
MLTFQELRVAFRAMGFKLTRPEIAQMLQEHGIVSPTAVTRLKAKGIATETHHMSVGNMLMPKLQFQQLAASRIVTRDPYEEVERAYNIFDSDKKGYIVYEDLKRVFEETGEHNMTEREMHAMIDEFDFDGTGTVAKDTFVSMLLGV